MAIWPFHWLFNIKTALPDVISATTFPKAFAWMERFSAVIEKSQDTELEPTMISGSEVAEYMRTAQFVEAQGNVDVNDPLSLRVGDVVKLWPIESGFSHKDQGRLLSLTPKEIVLSKNIHGGKEIRVHAQRWGFRIRKIENSDDKLSVDKIIYKYKIE